MIAIDSIRFGGGPAGGRGTRVMSRGSVGLPAGVSRLQGVLLPDEEDGLLHILKCEGVVRG